MAICYIAPAEQTTSSPKELRRVRYRRIQHGKNIIQANRKSFVVFIIKNLHRTGIIFSLKYRQISFYCASPFCSSHRCCIFLQIEGKTLHQQKDYNLLYCDTVFTAVVWYQTYNIFEIFLCVLNDETLYIIFIGYEFT